MPRPTSLLPSESITFSDLRWRLTTEPWRQCSSVCFSAISTSLLSKLGYEKSVSQESETNEGANGQSLADDAPDPAIDQDVLRAEYLDEHKALVEMGHKYAENFDKIALTISGGALALSVGFVKDIAPHPAPWSTTLLLLGWCSLGAAILASMMGLYWAQLSFDEERAIRYDQYIFDASGERTRKSWDNKHNSKIHKANLFVIASILLGVLLVLSFAGWNFVSKAIQDSKPRMEPKPASNMISPKPEPGASNGAPSRPAPAPTNVGKPTPKDAGTKK